jgi:hypothetical protein
VTVISAWSSSEKIYVSGPSTKCKEKRRKQLRLFNAPEMKML